MERRYAREHDDVPDDGDDGDDTPPDDGPDDDIPETEYHMGR